MKTVNCKILMYGDIFVDSMLLHKGIYEIEVPRIMNRLSTLESLIEAAKLLIDDNSEYIKNLEQCKLVDIELTIKIKDENANNTDNN